MSCEAKGDIFDATTGQMLERELVEKARKEEAERKRIEQEKIDKEERARKAKEIFEGMAAAKKAPPK